MYLITFQITPIISLSDAVDDQFNETKTNIDDEITEQQKYTDQEIEALRTEGCIQEAITS